MIDGAFLQGTLEMPQTLEEAAIRAQFIWSGVLLNRILAIACLILGIVVLADTVQIFPKLLDCIKRWRACISLEHNIGDARARNYAAAVSIFILGLVSSRFCLYGPEFASTVPAWGFTLICIAVVCGFFLLRLALMRLLKLDRIRGDEKKALLHTCSTFAIPTCFLIIPTILIFNAINVPEAYLRTIILLETGAGWLLAVSRSGHLLESHYSGLTTFLYLCALEIIPAATVVVSALVL